MHKHLTKIIFISLSLSLPLSHTHTHTYIYIPSKSEHNSRSCPVDNGCKTAECVRPTPPPPTSVLDLTQNNLVVRVQ